MFAVNHIRLVTASAPTTDLAPAYVDARTLAMVNMLKQWGFNAIGGDADADIWHRGLPFIESLDLSRHLQAMAQTAVFDVYAPTFAAQVDQIVTDACAPRAADPELIGYVSDQGLDWDPVRHPATVLAFYLSLPLQAPGRQRAMDFLRLRYDDDVRPLNRAWGTRAKDFTELAPPPSAAANPAFVHDAEPFAEQVLVRYMQAAANAIHQADPNHLYLGANLAANPRGLPRPQTNLALAWNVADVASFRAPDSAIPAFVAALTTVVHRPLLLRFEGCAATAAEAGLFRAPNLIGYVWTPAPDWQAPACAALAASQWWPLNRAAATLH